MRLGTDLNAGFMNALMRRASIEQNLLCCGYSAYDGVENTIETAKKVQDLGILQAF